MPSASPSEDRLIADCAQLLTVTLADPAELSFTELFDRIFEQAKDNEPVARRWIAAIDRVHADGRMTLDQAHAMITHVAHYAVGERVAADSQWIEAMQRMNALTESLNDLKGPRNRNARRAIHRERRKLAHKSIARQEVIVCEYLVTLGYDQLAQRIDTGKRDYRVSQMKSLKELWRREDEDRTGWKVAYPSADTPLTPRQVPERTDLKIEPIPVAERVEQWRQATTRESIWTVDAVLAFATVEAWDNLDGEGDRWIASILTAHRRNYIDRDLSWLLLDRVSTMMVPEEPGGDTVLHDLQELMDEIPYAAEYATADPPVDYDLRDRKEWEALNAVYERRRQRYKLRILSDAGADEMVKMIEQRPEEFKIRVATAATEWEVAD